ncbi:hypothetical protein NQ095_19545 [Rossellomorea sp. SC111]|uniref:hypothetical protein n=1 Tax=Rossellomorea sp. SC111 TaxID=2968985 RepID=UPI00215B14DE|nr:hypothetical protein [Rossellomorea sp. SC111]MCR8850620.1 hypothetical protein [Rossellomorea sp. SC111]
MTRIKDSKTETIIHEIRLWKQTKMLPEQYCDFLLALYTEGEGINDSPSAKPQKKTLLKEFLISISSLVISLFVIYFTELSIVLQTAILASFVGLLMGVGIYYSKKQFSPLLLYTSAACILFLSSIKITGKIFEGDISQIYMTLFLNCFIWIGAGVKWKMNYFTLAGSVGATLVGIYILL